MSRGKYNPDGGRESGLAGRIRQIIRESGVKQVEFAQSLGISANYVYLLTSGRKTAISETLARLIERVYGYPADWVLQGEEGGGRPVHGLQAEVLQRVECMSEPELRAVADFIRSMERPPSQE